MENKQISVTQPETVDVLGTNVSVLDLAGALRWIDGHMKTNRKGFVCFANVHGVIEASHNPELRDAYREADLVLPDGMPLAWYGRLRGRQGMQRCAGPDLMLKLVAHSRDKGYTHFFLGGAPAVAQTLASNFVERFAGLRVVGSFSPPYRPLSEAEERELVEQLHSLQPDIIWVGLGAPKQELFMSHYLPYFATRLMLGVGAAFDFHAGRLKRAPPWMSRLGLEWLHRLSQEPGRLWRRYAVSNVLFLYHAILQLSRLRRYGDGE